MSTVDQVKAHERISQRTTSCWLIVKGKGGGKEEKKWNELRAETRRKHFLSLA